MTPEGRRIILYRIGVIRRGLTTAGNSAHVLTANPVLSGQAKAICEAVDAAQTCLDAIMSRVVVESKP